MLLASSWPSTVKLLSSRLIQGYDLRLSGFVHVLFGFYHLKGTLARSVTETCPRFSLIREIHHFAGRALGAGTPGLYLEAMVWLVSKPRVSQQMRGGSLEQGEFGARKWRTCPVVTVARGRKITGACGVFPLPFAETSLMFPFSLSRS